MLSDNLGAWHLPPQANLIKEFLLLLNIDTIVFHIYSSWIGTVGFQRELENLIVDTYAQAERPTSLDLRLDFIKVYILPLFSMIYLSLISVRINL